MVMTVTNLLPVVVLTCLLLQATGQEKTPAAPAGAVQELPGFQLDGTRWTYGEGELAIDGILLKPEGEGPFPAVLISHGLGGSAGSFGMSKAREWVQWGWVCIAPNYTHSRGAGGGKAGGKGRGPRPADKGAVPAERATYGASEENIRRAQKCLEILESLPYVDKTRIGAYGHSMGGFVTVALAAAVPERLKAAAISGSGIAPRAGFPAPSNDVARKVRTPMLIIHGSLDRTVRPEQSAALKEILDENKIPAERHVFEGENHPVDQTRRDEVFGLIAKWFTTHMKLPEVPKVTPSAADQAAPPARQAAAAPGEPQWIKEPVTAKNTQYKTFTSQTIGREVSYLIYLPAEYTSAADKRYPVMYWLHGIGGAQTGVPRYVERLDDAIAAGKTPPMIVVFVNGVRDSFYCDVADGRTPVETVIIKDLIPHIDGTYRTVPKREGRIIEGFSMGGFGAAHLGFKFPELFCAVSLLDAALLNLGTMQNRHAALYQRIFGGREQAFQAEDPRALVEKNADAIRGRTTIRSAVGRIVEGNRSFHEQLTRLDIAHEYEVFEDAGHNHGAILDRLGDKNWEFYRAALGVK
jgi:endo-1,4-beta-xylanase